ncbi:MAG: ABC transporter substrate-binding protein [Paracoccaceae bacterium]
MGADSTRHNARPNRLRSFLTTVALSALVLGNPAAAQDTPRDGGNLTVHINRDIGGFDHIKVPQGGMGRFQVLWAVHERFFEKGENGTYIPALATEATASEDFKTWQIKLREDVLFSNGAPLTSETYTHHFARLLGSDLADNFRNVIGGDLQEVVAIDDLTLEFRFGEANPAFQALLASGGTYIMAANEVGFARANENDEEYNRMAVGTGPYMLEEWSPGEGVRLVRNPHYWNRDVQHLDEIFYRITTGPETGPAWNGLVAGDIDAMWSITGGALDRARDNDQFTLANGERDQMLWAVSFQTIHGPLDDPRLRQASSHAINRDVILDIVLKNAAPLADQSFPEGSPWHCDDIAYPSYDPDKAMALLAEIDEPIPPLELWTYNIPSWQQATEIIQAMWAEIGVEAEIKVGGRGPTGVVFQIQSGLTPTWMDVRGSLTHPTVFNMNFHSEHEGNFWKLDNPEIDAAIEAVRAATNDAELLEAHCAFEQVKTEVVPFLPISYAPAALIANDNVGGVTKPNDVVLGYHRLWLKEE